MTTPDNTLIDEFKVWLNDRRNNNVSQVFHETVGEFRKLTDRIASLEAEKLASKDDIELLQAKAKAMQVACATQVTSLEVELKKKSDTLTFVERWAVHHGTKPHITAEQALGFIQHHPRIKAITASYVDGKHPKTFDPYAEIEQLKAQLVTQTNRAAEAEQQVTALTQQLDTANALNTEARNQLAQLSQAQAVPTTALSNLRHLYKQMIDGFVSDASKAKRIAEGLLSPAIQKLERLAASTTPPARKGLSDERIADLWGESKRGFDIECEHYFKAFRDAEAAHGIQGEGNA